MPKTSDYVDTILPILKEKARKAMPLEPRYIEPCKIPQWNRFLGNESHVTNKLEYESQRLNEYYAAVFGHINYDPRNAESAEAICDLYVLGDPEKDSIEEKNFVNTSDGSYLLFEHIVGKVTPKKQVLFIVGPKGSGKTFFLNYFLCKHGSELTIKWKKIPIWLDIKEYYLQYDSKSGLIIENEINDINLEHYLSTSTLYKAFLYKDHYPVLSDFWDPDNKEVHSMLVHQWNSIPQMNAIVDDPMEIVNKFRNIWQSIIGRESAVDTEYVGEKFLRQLLSDPQLPMLAVVLNETLSAFLRRRGYSFIYVLDGLDNLDYFFNRQLYASVTRNILALFLDDHNANVFSGNILINLRDETYDRIIAIGGQWHGKRFMRFNIAPITPDRIILEKQSQALKGNSSFIRRNKSNHEERIYSYHNAGNLEKNSSGVIDRYHESFRSFSEQFMGHLIHSVKDLIRHIPIDEEVNATFILERLFAGNLRAFSNNYLGVHKYSRYAGRDHITGVNKICTKDWVFKEGLLLHGRLYLTTYKETFAFGKCIPNIFWFDSSKENANWHGLCCLRVLQCSQQDWYTREELIERIIGDFHYNTEIVAQTIDICVMHGMLHTMVARRAEEDCSRNSTGDSNGGKGLLLRVTPKGELLRDLVFQDASLFYYLALDTPLSRYVVSEKYIERSALLGIHKNQGEGPFEEFVGACALTCLTLIRHIFTQHKKEMEGFHGNQDKAKIYQLPGNDNFGDKILLGIAKMMTTNRKYDISYITSLQSKIMGL